MWILLSIASALCLGVYDIFKKNSGGIIMGCFDNYQTENFTFEETNNILDKINYLIENNYYDKEVINKYDKKFIENLYNNIKSENFEFQSYMAANKFYQSYALKSNDGKEFLIPAITRFVPTIDINERKMIIDPIKGMID